MRLLTAHKILISASILFFLFFALWELGNFFSLGDHWAVVRGMLYLLVAAGFAVYFKNLKRWYQ